MLTICLALGAPSWRRACQVLANIVAVSPATAFLEQNEPGSTAQGFPSSNAFWLQALTNSRLERDRRMWNPGLILRLILPTGR